MKKVFLCLVIILIIVININSFAYTIPEIPVKENYDYWVVLKGRDENLYCYISKDPVLVANLGDRIAIRNYYMYRYIEQDGVGKWDWYRMQSGTGYDYYYFTEIIDANHDLMYENGEEYYWIGDYIADVKILQPPDGYVDTTEIYTIDVLTEFKKFISEEEKDNIVIDVKLNGDSVKDEIEILEANMMKGSQYSIHKYSFNIEIPAGENKIEVIYKYVPENYVMGKDSVSITRLVGFIDENNDGIDDRIDHLQYTDQVFSWDVENIGQNIYKVLKNMYNTFSVLFSFIKQVFGMFPAQIVAVSMAFISLLVLLRILGR